MTLSLGELVAFVDIDDSGFDRTMSHIDRTMLDTAKNADRHFGAIAESLDFDAEFAGITANLVGMGDMAEEQTSRMSKAFDAAKSALGKTASTAISTAATIGKIGIAATAASTATAVAAAGIGAALLGGLTLGVAGLGVWLAFEGKLKDTFEKFKETAKKSFMDASKPLHGPLKDGLDMLEKKLEPLGKALSKAFKQAAPIVEHAFDVASDVIDTVVKTLPSIVKAGRPVAEFFIDVLGGAISGFLKGMKWIGDAIAEFKKGLNGADIDTWGSKLGIAGGILATVGEGVAKWGSLLGHLGEMFSSSGATFSAWGAKAEEIFGKAKQIFNDVFSTVQQWITDNQGTIQGWVDGLKSGFETAMSAISSALDVIKAVWDIFGDDILNILGTLVTTFIGVWNGLWKVVKGVFDTFAGLFTGDWKRMGDGLRTIWDGLWKVVESILSGALDLIKMQLSRAWEVAKALTSKAWEGLKKAVSSAIDGVIKFVKELPGDIKSGLGKLGTLLLQAGKDVVQGLINGIKSKVRDLVNTAANLGTAAAAAIKKALDSHSPSRVFMQIGKWTVEGFILGIQGSAEKARTTVTNLATMVKDAFKQAPGAPDALVDWVGKETDRLKTIADRREKIIQAIADAKKYAADIAGQAKDFANLSNLGLGEGAGASDIIGGLNKKLSDIKKFAKDIQLLAKKGLSKAVLKQIIDAGVEKGLGLAEMLVGASGSEIKAINKAQAAIDKTSKQLGKNAADAMFDTGKKAADGFLRGLQGELKKLDSMMAKIAKAVVDAVKKQLKIKSPSRVMMDLGTNTMLGYIQGIAGQADAVTGTMGDILAKLLAKTQAATVALPAMSAGSLLAHAAGSAGAGSGPGYVDGSQPSGPSITNNFYGSQPSPDAVVQQMWFSAHAAGY